jgi:hypothetical protein
MKRILLVIQRNYKLYVIVISLLKLLSVKSYGQELFLYEGKPDYHQIFQDKYDEAYNFIKENKWISDSLKIHGIDPDFALAIVFPELIRYSELQDKMEVGGLLALYVQYGKKYADFSVGRFQMKPTFVEQLETDTKKNIFEVSDSMDLSGNSRARMDRVNRLNNIHWQVRYLCLFLQVMEKKYLAIRWNSDEERLAFYATAYNSGYLSGEEIIRNRMSAKMFYTGLIRSEPCYCYADIALEYYKNREK